MRYPIAAHSRHSIVFIQIECLGDLKRMILPLGQHGLSIDVTVAEHGLHLLIVYPLGLALASEWIDDDEDAFSSNNVCDVVKWNQNEALAYTAKRCGGNDVEDSVDERR